MNDDIDLLVAGKFSRKLATRQSDDGRDSSVFDALLEQCTSNKACNSRDDDFHDEYVKLGLLCHQRWRGGLHWSGAHSSCG